MRDDILNPVDVIGDCEVEALCSVYARLPEISDLVVFLRAQRWVLEIGSQEAKLFLKGPLDVSRSVS